MSASKKYTPEYSSKKCGDCIHWHEIPINENLQRAGMCRLLPPSPIVTPGAGGLNVQFVYPQVGKDNGACASYDAIMVLKVVD